MRAFTEAGKKTKSIMVEFTKDECHIIAEAMFDFCERNKRRTKAQNLLTEMDAKFEIY